MIGMSGDSAVEREPASEPYEAPQVDEIDSEAGPPVTAAGLSGSDTETTPG